MCNRFPKLIAEANFSPFLRIIFQRSGTNTIKLIFHNTSAVKLWLDFDAKFEFAPATLYYQFEVILMLPL